jgi:hypothetical protein
MLRVGYLLLTVCDYSVCRGVICNQSTARPKGDYPEQETQNDEDYAKHFFHTEVLTGKIAVSFLVIEISSLGVATSEPNPTKIR